MSEWSETSSQKELVANLPKIVITYHDTEDIRIKHGHKTGVIANEHKTELSEDYWADVKTHEHFVGRAQREDESEEMKIGDIDEMFGANR